MPAEKIDLQTVLTLTEFEPLGQSCMSPMTLGYIMGGAGDELTLCANCDDWKRVRLAPRVLVDVSQLDLRTEILGQTLEMPIMLAPAAFHRLCHPEGEMATVAGANEGGAAVVLSSFSTVAVEQITAVAKHPVWFQLYFQQDRGLTQEMVRRSEAAGCKALCITVDTPVLGARHRESRTRFELPADFKLPNLKLGPVSHRPSRSAIYSQLLNAKLNWKDIEWLCSLS